MDIVITMSVYWEQEVRNSGCSYQRTYQDLAWARPFPLDNRSENVCSSARRLFIQKYRFSALPVAWYTLEDVQFASIIDLLVPIENYAAKL